MIKNVMIFVAGAIAGAAATYFYMKRNEKTESVSWGDVAPEAPVEKKEEPVEEPENDIPDYIDDFYKEEMKKEETKHGTPYVIPPTEFGGMGDEYNVVTLVYYKDGVLTEENDFLVGGVSDIVDIDDTVGHDSLKHFGEYFDDVVYVRNDERRCDYEVCLDERRYADIVAEKHPDDVDDILNGITDINAPVDDSDGSEE